MSALSDYSMALVSYVIAHGPRVSVNKSVRCLTQEEAMSWLDTNCPQWRLGLPPENHRHVVIEYVGRDPDEEN